jgi:hypothetical protein
MDSSPSSKADEQALIVAHAVAVMGSLPRSSASRHRVAPIGLSAALRKVSVSPWKKGEADDVIIIGYLVRAHGDGRGPACVVQHDIAR